MRARKSKNNLPSKVSWLWILKRFLSMSCFMLSKNFFATSFLLYNRKTYPPSSLVLLSKIMVPIFSNCELIAFSFLLILNCPSRSTISNILSQPLTASERNSCSSSMFPQSSGSSTFFSNSSTLLKTRSHSSTLRFYRYRAKEL